jgi:hypothetical protein
MDNLQAHRRAAGGASAAMQLDPLVAFSPNRATPGEPTSALSSALRSTSGSCSIT